MPVLSAWDKKYLKEKMNTKHNKSCLQDEACLGTKAESPKANYGTSMAMHMFERSQKSSNNLPPTTSPYTPRLATAPYCFHSAAGERSRLPCKYRFLITVLVHQKIKIPASHCLEYKVAMLFDSYFTFE